MVTRSQGSCGKTDAAERDSTDNVQLEPIQSQATIKRDLDIARQLARWGVPIFLGWPDLDKSGRWLPRGGHGKTGYRFPRKWQLTKPDPRVVNRWKPGMALCAVMGKVVDLLDSDPRNGGDDSRKALVEAGSWPTVYWQAATPSDGLHDFVATLGVRSKNGVRPGLDVKAGKDGKGHGIAFIAPTVRAAKPSGELKAYRWIVEPTTRPATGDNTGRAMAQIVEPSGGVKQPGKASTSKKASTAQDWRDRLNALPKEAPCETMRAQRDIVAGALTRTKWHRTGRGAVIQLIRLAREGHGGLRQAVEALSDDFVATASERAGGDVEAQQVWDTSVDEAMVKVLGTDGRFPARPACDCLIRRFHLACQDPSLFSAGIASVTERRVMGYLVEAARLKRSLLVRESQRQIAEAIDCRQATASHALKRLEALGWLRPMAGVDPLAPTPILLLLPEKCEVAQRNEPDFPLPPLLAGPLVDTSLRVHRLFGPAGLGGGVQETFSALPEYRVEMRRGILVRVLPGFSTSTGLANPLPGTRQIPRPAPGGGRTVQDLAHTTGKHPSTIRRQLKKLLDRGLVFEEVQTVGPSRWWRLRFDPDLVADRDEIPHTAVLKTATHVRDRRRYFDGRIAYARSKNLTPRVERVSDADGVLYVDTISGQILWVDYWSENEGHLD